MSRIKPAIRTYITQQLACFDSPSVVAESVQKAHGVSISRQVIEGHDPTKRAGERLGRKYKEIFFATRNEYFKATAGIAISHKAYRLRSLQRMFDKAEGQGNVVLACKILEQAAKEMGGDYDNKRIHEVSGPGGKPIETNPKVTTIDPKQLSTETLKELLRIGRDSASVDQE